MNLQPLNPFGVYMKKVKLKKGILKKYGFSMGGDMDESVYIAIDMSTGNPVTYKDFNTKHLSVHVMAFDYDDSEFAVVDHDRPMSARQFKIAKELFENISDKEFKKDLKKSKKEKEYG